MEKSPDLTAALVIKLKQLIRQKHIPKQKRIERKLKKVKKTKDYFTKLLTDGKSWLGQCTSLDDLLNAILAQS